MKNVLHLRGLLGVLGGEFRRKIRPFTVGNSQEISLAPGGGMV
jgi:hypothetical protein